MKLLLTTRVVEGGSRGGNQVGASEDGCEGLDPDEEVPATREGMVLSMLSRR